MLVYQRVSWEVQTLEVALELLMMAPQAGSFHRRYGGASGKSEKASKVGSCCGREWGILPSIMVYIYTYYII